MILIPGVDAPEDGVSVNVWNAKHFFSEQSLCESGLRAI